MSLDFSNDLQQLREEVRAFVASKASSRSCKAGARSAEPEGISLSDNGTMDGRPLRGRMPR
jgi:hypothetical protein